MEKHLQETLEQISSAFGEAQALDSYIGKEKARQAEKLADRYLEALHPSRRAKASGAVSHLITLTADEADLLEEIYGKNIPW